MRDGHALWEILILGGFQAAHHIAPKGRIRRAFDGFVQTAVAAYDQTKIEVVLDEDIIRARAKIEATIRNARAYLRVEA